MTSMPAGAERETMVKNMEGFDRLFMRYLVSDAGPSIKWDGISPPPEEKVIPFAHINAVDDQDQVANLLNKVRCGYRARARALWDLQNRTAVQNRKKNTAKIT